MGERVKEGHKAPGRDAISLALLGFLAFLALLTTTGCPVTSLAQAAAVAADKASLQITFSSGDSASSVTQDLTLPAGGANGTAISWASSNTDIVSTTGAVTRPKTTTDVSLTATISKGSESDTKPFPLTVLQAPVTDAQAVAVDKASLQITFASGDSAASVTQNLTLPTAGENSTAISWASTNTGIVGTTGVVTRPATTTDVTLTATISKGSTSDTKLFPITIIGDAPITQSPLNGQVKSDRRPLLDWQEATPSTAYHLQVNTSSDFSGAVILEDSGLAASEYQIILPLTDHTIYYWRVRSKNYSGVWSNWSSVSSFQVLLVREVAPADLYRLHSIASGASFTLTLRTDGTVWAWGSNSDGQLGNASYSDSLSPVRVKGVGGSVYLTDVISVAASGSSSYALKSDGSVWAWGNNGSAQLGDGSYTKSPYPIQVQTLTGVVSISAGRYHCLALRNDGTVWAWGYNGNGQLGDNTTFTRTTPVQVLGASGSGYLSGISAVSAGGCQSLHSLALASDGTTWGWGYNGDGSLGDGSWNQCETPVQTSGPTSVIHISGGASFSILLKSDNSVWACGSRSYGECGDGTYSSQSINIPKKIDSFTGITIMSAGDFHSIALRSDGTVWAWGYNANGQLGMGNTANRCTPGMVGPALEHQGLASFDGVTMVVAGLQSSFALKSDQTMWAWGYDGGGKLGIGSSSGNSLNPVQVIW